MKPATRKNITSGNLFKGILLFAFPLLISTLVQNLFTSIDTIVVGNFANSLAVAAIGATTNVTSLLVNCFVAMSGSANILVARAVGANDGDKVKRSVDTALTFAAVVGLILVVCATALTIPVLHLLKCPEECFDSAVLYLRIYMCGTPFVLLYNFSAAIIRAEGDSARPLTYVMISGVLNVICNVLLCLVLPNKVAAVAIATVLSQVVSAFLALRRLLTKKDGFCRLCLKTLRFHGKTLLEILRFGVPLALSNVIYPLAGLQIQPAINSYGAAALAGQTSAQQINALISSFHGAFSSTCLTFASQNIGARNRKRVEKSIMICTSCGFLCGLILGLLCTFIIPDQLMNLYVPGDADAIFYGKTFMKYVCAFAGVNALNSCIGAALQAFGYPTFTTLNSLISVLGFRIVWMNFVYVLKPNIDRLFVCFTISWWLVFVMGSSLFIHAYRQYRKKEILSASP